MQLELWQQFVRKRDELPGVWTACIRGAFLVAAAFLGCVLIELPWREGFDHYDPVFFLYNVALCAVALAVVYLVGQCTRVSIAVFLILCLILGMAFHFVVEFKGQVILPADVAAVGTALSVSQGYTYQLDERSWICIALTLAYLAALAVFCPRRKLSYKGRIGAALGAVVVLTASVYGFAAVQLDDTLGFQVSNWAPRGSYYKQGALLSFLALAQDAHMPEPADYSDERARQILSAYQDERAAWLASAHDGNAPQRPTVIVVMNESFADLQSLVADKGELFVPAACRSLQEQSAVGGTALASVYGGGTCNSEFEFLTGTSMAFQAGGYYPYMFQDFSQVNSVPRYFQSLGYATVAMHPNWPANWRREQVYPALGFDEFLSIGDWNEPERVRGEVRDSELYGKILQYLDDVTEPQFIFAVSMTNHGGYGRAVEEEYVAEGAAELEGELSVYASLIQLSDSDLGAFADELQERDTPVVLCFFGDHQPKLSDVLLQEATNAASGDALHGEDLATLEQCYEVPYFIWENEAQKAVRDEAMKEADVADGSEFEPTSSSLCYLSAQLVQAAGLPQTSFMQLADAVRARYPLFNAIGYYDDGQWLSYNVRDASPELLNEYAIASYGLLAGDVEGGEG